MEGVTRHYEVMGLLRMPRPPGNARTHSFTDVLTLETMYIHVDVSDTCCKK